jgi:hypothetical protein
LSRRRVPVPLEGLGTACAIYRATPFPETRMLAAIARLRLDDWTALGEVRQLLSVDDDRIRNEAAHAISSWRVVYAAGIDSVLRRDVVGQLRRSTIQGAAARLALLGDKVEATPDPRDFTWTLAAGDIDRLTTATAADDPLTRFAAAICLIKLGVLAPVAAVLPVAAPDHLDQLLTQLEICRRPAPELRDALFEIAESASVELRRRALEVLCFGCRPGDALRIARAADGDPAIYQSLFQRAKLVPEELEQLGEFMLDRGEFDASQFGLEDISRKDGMPSTFVPRRWTEASPTARIELVKFAEMQLRAYADENLHRFLVEVAFTPGTVDIQGTAWSSLYRWYDSFGYPRRRPIRIEAGAIAGLFGSPERFMSALRRFLGDGIPSAILGESIHRDQIAELLRYGDADVLPGFAESLREAAPLIEAVAAVVRSPAVDFTLRIAAIDFLVLLAGAGRFRAGIASFLSGLKGTDVDHQATVALARLLP